MFSIITIASSTTKPVEIVSAISERLSRLYPSRYMTANVPTSDSGTAMPGMMVAEALRRNRKMTITTSAVVSISSNSTSSTEARMVVVRSVMTCDVDPLRQRRLDLRQQRLHGIDDADDVGSGLALNVQNDGAVGVHPRGQLGVFRAVDHRGDVGNAHRRAVAVGDDDRPVLRAGLQLVVVVDGPGLIRTVEIALGLIHVGAGQRRAQRLQTQAVGRQRGGIGLHPDGRTLSAADADQTDAFELRNSLRHARFRQLLDLGQRHGRRT